MTVLSETVTKLFSTLHTLRNDINGIVVSFHVLENSQGRLLLKAQHFFIPSNVDKYHYLSFQLEHIFILAIASMSSQRLI